MQWLTDLFFPGLYWEEIARAGELGMMTVMLLISVFAVGATSEEWGALTKPVRVPSKRI